MQRKTKIKYEVLVGGCCSKGKKRFLFSMGSLYVNFK